MKCLSVAVQVQVGATLAGLLHNLAALLIASPADVATGATPGTADPLAPQALTDFTVSPQQRSAHVLHCCELASILTTLLHNGPEHRAHHVATLNWPAIQAQALGIQPRSARASPLLTAAVAVADTAVAGLLSVRRERLMAAVLRSEAVGGCAPHCCGLEQKQQAVPDVLKTLTCTHGGPATE